MAKVTEPRQQEAAELAAHKENELEPLVNEQASPEEQANPRVIESLEHFPNLHPWVEGNHSILNEIKEGYTKDSLCSKILENVGHHKKFKIMDDLLYTYRSIVHLVPIHTTMTASKLTWQYIWEIVRLHRLLEMIVSNQDSKFMSKF